MYESGKSITQIHKETGVPLSTIRFRVAKAGKLRSRTEGIALAGENGRLGSGRRGKAITFTDEWKRNISIAKSGKGDGRTKKRNGYIEITMGENKGRLEHVVVMEREIGRRLYANECVHHKDHDRANNDLENLQLMTRTEHARLHALENINRRQRDEKGRLK